MAEFIRRNVPKRKDPGVASPVMPCALSKNYPAIVEFLTVDVWDEKAVRDPGTLLLCFGDGRWKCWLNDRDSGMNAWLSGETLTDLLDSVEDALRAGSVDWRTAPGPRKGGKGR